MKKKRIVVIFATVFAAAMLFCAPLHALAQAETGQIEEIGAQDEAVADENPFRLFADRLIASLPDFFSAAACVASLLIVFTYKKGFLPLVGGALEKMREGVRSIGEQAEKQTEGSAAFGQKIAAALGQTEDGLRKATASIAALEEKLPAVARQEGEHKLFAAVLSAQIDLLADIFRASSLPQYEKERIAARADEMREMIRKLREDEVHAGADRLPED